MFVNFRPAEVRENGFGERKEVLDRREKKKAPASKIETLLFSHNIFTRLHAGSKR